jgi:hypothetical protein
MNNLNLWEVSEPYRTNISRRRINRKQKGLKKSLESQASSLCKDTLSERYIHNAFTKYDSGYVYYDADEDKILAFCLWKRYDTQLHILLLCSKYPEYGLGKTILGDIEYYCFEAGLGSIVVTPADKDLVSYYGAFGFKIMDGDSTQLIKSVEPFRVKRGRKNKTRRVPMAKRSYPIVASMMPIDMNTWKNTMI